MDPHSQERGLPLLSPEVKGVPSLHAAHIHDAGSERCTLFTDRKRMALERSLKKAQDTEDPVAITIAHVRAELLGFTHHEYSRELALRANTLRTAEKRRDTSPRRHYDTYSRILADWESRAADASPSELSVELRTARREVLRALVGKDEGTSLGVLLKWRYIHGSNFFDERTGLNTGSLWNRRSWNILPPFRETIHFAKKLDLVPKRSRGDKVWSHPELAEAKACWIMESEQRERPRAVATLHAMIQCTGHRCTYESLIKFAPDILRITASKLAKFEIVPWSRVQPLLNSLEAFGLKEEALNLRDAWRREYRRERNRQSSTNVIRGVIGEGAPGSTAIAIAMGLPDDSSSTRRSRQLIQHVIKGYTISPKAPFAAVALLISSDFEVLNKLLALRRKEMERSMRRKGALYCSPLQLERQLWGVSLAELPSDKMQLQRLEQGRKVDKSVETELKDRVPKIGASKLLDSADAGRVTLNSAQRSILKSISEHGYDPSCGIILPTHFINSPEHALTRASLTEVKLPSFVKKRFPKAEPSVLRSYLDEIEARTPLRPKNREDRAAIKQHLVGMLRGTLIPAYYGDSITIEGTEERRALYALRTQLGFDSIFHENDGRASLM